MALTKVDDRGVTYPLDLLDNEKIRFGTGNDLELYHSPNDSYIKNTTGDLRLLSDSNLILRSADQSENYIVATKNSDVELYYDGSKKLETLSGGVNLLGNVGINTTSPHTASGQTHLTINQPATGTQVAGIHFQIGESTKGTILSYPSADEGLRLTTFDAGKDIRFYKNISGSDTQLARIEDGGDFVLTGGNVVLTDNKKLQLGASQDIEIYHDGTHSRFKNQTGGLYFHVHNGEFLNRAGDEVIAKFLQNSRCELYYDHSKKFETTSTGAKVQSTGIAELTIWAGEAANSELHFYADENDDSIDHWKISANGNTSKLNIQNYDGSNWESVLVGTPNGATELYHNGSKKLETSSSGATVTGTVTATAFSGDGIIPSGGIIIWSGASNAIPTGWLICDGTNSTPDLRNRFVVGAGSTYSVGATGGSDSVTLTTAQIPSHTHPIQIRTGRDDDNFSFNQGFSSDANTDGGTFNSNSTGGGGSHENRPPYYALCYIMKS